MARGALGTSSGVLLQCALDGRALTVQQRTQWLVGRSRALQPATVCLTRHTRAATATATATAALATTLATC